MHYSALQTLLPLENKNGLHLQVLSLFKTQNLATLKMMMLILLKYLKSIVLLSQIVVIMTDTSQELTPNLLQEKSSEDGKDSVVLSLMLLLVLTSILLGTTMTLKTKTKSVLKTLNIGSDK